MYLTCNLGNILDFDRIQLFVGSFVEDIVSNHLCYTQIEMVEVHNFENSRGSGSFGHIHHCLNIYMYSCNILFGMDSLPKHLLIIEFIRIHLVVHSNYLVEFALGAQNLCSCYYNSVETGAVDDLDDLVNAVEQSPVVLVMDTSVNDEMVFAHTDLQIILTFITLHYEKKMYSFRWVLH